MQKQAFDLQSLANSVIQSASKEFGNLKQIRERPFEILFRYLVPGFLFARGHWILATLLGAAQAVIGIGPEMIGAMIDKAIGKGPGSGDTGISESGLATASKGIVDRITGLLLTKSTAFRIEIMKRSTLDAQSLVVAWAHGQDKLEKQAYSGWANQLKSFLVANPMRGRGLISGLLLSLLKYLAVGLGIQVGVGALFDKAKTFPFGGVGSSTGPKSKTPAPGMRLYTNPVGDVEQALVIALDNLIKDKTGKPFSRIFMDLKGYSPIDSPEMGRVLSEVRSAHGGATIQEIDSYRTFAAPPLTDVANMLLPQATYTKQTPSKSTVGKISPKKSKTPSDGDAERELESLFGGVR